MSAPLIQQVYRHRHQPRTVPRPFIAQQRPQQPSHRPESYQHTRPAPTQHRCNQANKTNTKPYQQKSVQKRHSPQPAASSEQKNTQTSVRHRHSKHSVPLPTKQTPELVQQPRRVHHQTRNHQPDHTRAVSQTKYDNSRHQKRTDTPQQQTYASVL